MYIGCMAKSNHEAAVWDLHSTFSELKDSRNSLSLLPKTRHELKHTVTMALSQAALFCSGCSASPWPHLHILQTQQRDACRPQRVVLLLGMLRGSRMWEERWQKQGKGEEGRKENGAL